MSDVKLLEDVQRRATKMVSELQHLSYNERLTSLKLYPLSDRRRRGDMIATFKILNGFTDCNQQKLIPLSSNTNKATRSHIMQITRTIPRSCTRQNFYTNRIVLPWNKLSNHTIDSITINEFKERYDREVLGDYLISTT